jgi:hypothetical protein
MKLLLTLYTFLFLVMGHSQIEESNLVKGKWQFCVMDTIMAPFKCDAKYTVYKFKRSGKYVEKGISMVSNGKEIKKLKGVWTLTGTTLEIDADDFERLKIGSKTIPLEFINKDVLFSAQKDYKTVYWLFTRLKK